MKKYKIELHFKMANGCKCTRVIHEWSGVISTKQKIVLYICNYIVKNNMLNYELLNVKIEKKERNDLVKKVNDVLELTSIDVNESVSGNAWVYENAWVYGIKTVYEKEE